MKLTLLEYTDVQTLVQNLNIPKMDVEQAWLNGDERTIGTKDKVEVDINQNDIKDKFEYMIHTHPEQTGTVFDVFPSEQDLKTSAESYGIFKGHVIISGNYYCVIKPEKEDIQMIGYDRFFEQCVKENDPVKLSNKIESMGFDIGFGLKDQK